MRGTGIANSFRSRVCPRRCSAGILSEREGARAGEENEGRYGRCDFAVHDLLLMISRMRTTGFKGQRADKSAVSLSNRGQKNSMDAAGEHPAVADIAQHVFEKRSPAYHYLVFSARSCKLSNTSARLDTIRGLQPKQRAICKLRDI